MKALFVLVALAAAPGEKPKTMPEPAFARGPELSPAATLLEWLGRQDARVRLPVSVEWTALGVRSAKIGVNREEDAVPITLGDARLGISLADRAEQMCEGENPCALSLEGHWRSAGRRFELTAVRRAIQVAARPRATFAEIEGKPLEVTWIIEGVPVPKIARELERGATSLADGRNFERRVFEVAADFELVAGFYRQHFAGAEESSDDRGRLFAAAPAKAVLTKTRDKTRIELTLGPR